MGDAESLPDDIRGLTRRTAIDLSHARWRSDVQPLVSAIQELLPEGEKH